MHRELGRRDFLKVSADYLAGIGLLPLMFAATLRPRSGGRVLQAGGKLPPRTIGLRTLGGDFRFDPPGLRIDPGESVIWLNMGDFHTASAFHPDNSGLLNIDVPLRIPEGATSWHSGMLGLTGGTEFRHAFELEGVYDYFCQPHYSFGMVGRIIVGGPQGGPAVTRPLSELNEAAQRTMPTLQEIMSPRGRTFEWAARLNGLLWLRAHGDSVSGPAAAVRVGAKEDADLQRVLHDSGETSDFSAKLSDLLKAIAEGANYEALVARADETKEILRKAHSTG